MTHAILTAFNIKIRSNQSVYLISLIKTGFKLELHQITLVYLVAMDTHVMSGGEGLEDDHPAGIGGSLKQCVSHLRDVHVGGIGG